MSIMNLSNLVGWNQSQQYGMQPQNFGVNAQIPAAQLKVTKETTTFSLHPGYNNQGNVQQYQQQQQGRYEAIQPVAGPIVQHQSANGQLTPVQQAQNIPQFIIQQSSSQIQAVSLLQLQLQYQQANQSSDMYNMRDLFQSDNVELGQSRQAMPQATMPQATMPQALPSTSTIHYTNQNQRNMMCQPSTSSAQSNVSMANLPPSYESAVNNSNTSSFFNTTPVNNNMYNAIQNKTGVNNMNVNRSVPQIKVRTLDSLNNLNMQQITGQMVNSGISNEIIRHDVPQITGNEDFEEILNESLFSSRGNSDLSALKNCMDIYLPHENVNHTPQRQQTNSRRNMQQVINNTVENSLPVGRILNTAPFQNVQGRNMNRNSQAVSAPNAQVQRNSFNSMNINSPPPGGVAPHAHVERSMSKNLPPPPVVGPSTQVQMGSIQNINKNSPPPGVSAPSAQVHRNSLQNITVGKGKNSLPPNIQVYKRIAPKVNVGLNCPPLTILPPSTQVQVPSSNNCSLSNKSPPLVNNNTAPECAAPANNARSVITATHRLPMTVQKPATNINPVSNRPNIDILNQSRLSLQASVLSKTQVPLANAQNLADKLIEDSLKGLPSSSAGDGKASTSSPAGSKASTPSSSANNLVQTNEKPNDNPSLIKLPAEKSKAVEIGNNQKEGISADGASKQSEPLTVKAIFQDFLKGSAPPPAESENNKKKDESENNKKNDESENEKKNDQTENEKKNDESEENKKIDEVAEKDKEEEDIITLGEFLKKEITHTSKNLRVMNMTPKKEVVSPIVSPDKSPPISIESSLNPDVFPNDVEIILIEPGKSKAEREKRKNHFNGLQNESDLNSPIKKKPGPKSKTMPAYLEEKKRFSLIEESATNKNNEETHDCSKPEPVPVKVNIIEADKNFLNNAKVVNSIKKQAETELNKRPEEKKLTEKSKEKISSQKLGEKREMKKPEEEKKENKISEEKKEVKKPEEKKEIKKPEEKNVIKKPEEKNVIKKPEEKNVIKKPEEKNVIKKPEEKNEIKKPEDNKEVKKPEDNKEVKKLEGNKEVKKPEEKSIQKPEVKPANEKQETLIKKVEVNWAEKLKNSASHFVAENESLTKKSPNEKTSSDVPKPKKIKSTETEGETPAKKPKLTEQRTEPTKNDQSGNTADCANQDKQTEVEKKLELLKKFVENDEPSSSNLKRRSSSEEESGRRRKLSKTEIVKNKNIEREKISMLSKDFAQRSAASKSDWKKNKPELTKTQKTGSKSFKDKESEKTSPKSSESDSSTENEEAKEADDNNNKSLNEDVKPNLPELTKTDDAPSLSSRITDGSEEFDFDSRMQEFRSVESLRCMSCAKNTETKEFWVNIKSYELKCTGCLAKLASKNTCHNPNHEDEITKLRLEIQALKKENRKLQKKRDKKILDPNDPLGFLMKETKRMKKMLLKDSSDEGES